MLPYGFPEDIVALGKVIAGMAHRRSPDDITAAAFPHFCKCFL
jgi:hypothetical protein